VRSITGVERDVALTLPWELRAMTRTRILWPRSALTTV
jgi:hypothetical protein